MRNFIHLVLTILFFISLSACKDGLDSGNDGDDTISRQSFFKVYCMEVLMADAAGWTITFDNDDIKTKGKIFSMPDSEYTDEIQLNEEFDFGTGLPFGSYNGTRARDGKEIFIYIRGIDLINSTNSPIKWYIGSTVVDSNESDITCWDARE